MFEEHELHMTRILEQFLKFDMHTSHLETLLSAHSDTAGLGWGLGFCISSKHPKDTDAANQGTTVIVSTFR